MTNKRPIFIDLDKGIVATWEGKKEDPSTTSGEVLIEYTPFGRWLPFSLPFTEGIETTGYSVNETNIRTFEPTYRSISGQQRSIKVIVRPEGKFSQFVTEQDSEKINELRQDNKELKRKLREAKDEDSKDDTDRRRSRGPHIAT